MKIDRKYKPQLVVSKDDEHSMAIAVLNVVETHKNINGPAIVATDGSRLAVVPCELEEGDVPGQLRPDAVTLAASECPATQYSAKAHKNVKPEMVSAHLGADRLLMESSASFPRYSKDGQTTKALLGTYPNTDAVVPHVKTFKYKAKINPTMLLELVRAIGGKGDRVILQFADEFSPIYVAIDNEKAFGVLMPVGAK